MTDNFEDLLHQMSGQMNPSPDLLAELKAKIDGLDDLNLADTEAITDEQVDDILGTTDSPSTHTSVTAASGSPANTHSTNSGPATPPPAHSPRTSKLRNGTRILAAAMSLVTVGSLSLAIGNATARPPVQNWSPPVVVTGSTGTGSGQKPVDATGYAAIYKAITSVTGSRDSAMYGSGGAIEEGAAIPASAPQDMSGTASGAGDTYTGESADFSGTNVQVEGIDEGDIVKTDGSYLYIGSGRTVYIVDATGTTSHTVAQIDTSTTKAAADIATGAVVDMMIDGSTLMVFTHGYSAPQLDNLSRQETGLWLNVDDVKVSFYDISNPANPKYVSTLTQAGTYSTSRLLDGVLYLVSSYYVPEEGINKDDPVTYTPWVDTGNGAMPCAPADVYIYPAPMTPEYSLVTATNVANRTKISEQAVLGGSSTVYMSDSNLYLAGTTWMWNGLEDTKPVDIPADAVSQGQQTQLVRIGLNSGHLSAEANTTIAGNVLNQFSLDELDGNLRVVTTYETQEPDAAKGITTSAAGLWILDPSLKLVGSIPSLVAFETVQSVRFMGPTAYVVTFERRDPLFSIDVSDPANPVVQGALKIPGFSAYLHPWTDGLLLGIGVDADDNGTTTGIKLSMFDITDPYNVTEAAVTTQKNGYTDVQYDHKSVFVDVKRGLVGFPTYLYDSQGGVTNSYLIYSYADGQFTQQASLALTDADSAHYGVAFARGVRVGDMFYTATSQKVVVYTMDWYKALATVPLQ